MIAAGLLLPGWSPSFGHQQGMPGDAAVRDITCIQPLEITSALLLRDPRAASSRAFAGSSRASTNRVPLLPLDRRKSPLGSR